MWQKCGIIELVKFVCFVTSKIHWYYFSKLVVLCSHIYLLTKLSTFYPRNHYKTVTGETKTYWIYVSHHLLNKDYSKTYISCINKYFVSIISISYWLMNIICLFIYQYFYYICSLNILFTSIITHPRFGWVDGDTVDTARVAATRVDTIHRVVTLVPLPHQQRLIMGSRHKPLYWVLFFCKQLSMINPW